VKDYRGEWIWVSDTLKKLRSNFADIAAKVEEMADSASSGNFDAQTDIDAFEGKWKEMVASLMS